MLQLKLFVVLAFYIFHQGFENIVFDDLKYFLEDLEVTLFPLFVCCI